MRTIALHVRAARALEQERDVRERPGGHERDRQRARRDRPRHELHGALGRAARRLAGGSAGPSRPLSPWTWDATVSSRASGRSAPAATGDLAAAGEIEHAQGVRRRLRERLVPVHGRDAEHLHLGARERQQQRDRIVVPGIAVEDDRGAHARSIGHRPLNPRWRDENGLARV